MARWARRPPSARRVVYVLAVIAVCLILFGIERVFGWPDFLTPSMTERGRIAR